MAVRTIATTVVFQRPFTLSAFDGPQPAGTYRLEADEEEILDLSFLAFRRTATVLHIPCIEASQGLSQRVPVDQAELDAALAQDRQRQTA